MSTLEAVGAPRGFPLRAGLLRHQLGAVATRALAHLVPVRLGVEPVQVALLVLFGLVVVSHGARSSVHQHTGACANGAAGGNLSNRKPIGG